MTTTWIYQITEEGEHDGAMVLADLPPVSFRGAFGPATMYVGTYPADLDGALRHFRDVGCHPIPFAADRIPQPS